MITQKNNTYIDNRPIRFFDTAQEAWMWFCFCETMPSHHAARQREWTRPCETSDIAIAVKRLVREKKISQSHLKVLSQYGLKQLPPDERCGDSKTVCDLWKQALYRLFEVLKLKGIVGASSTAFCL